MFQIIKKEQKFEKILKKVQGCGTEDEEEDEEEEVEVEDEVLLLLVLFLTNCGLPAFPRYFPSLTAGLSEDSGCGYLFTKEKDLAYCELSSFNSSSLLISKTLQAMFTLSVMYCLQIAVAF